MEDLRTIGRYLLATGILLSILGGLFMLSEKMPWIGHLPGDVHVDRKNIRFYFPLGACVVLSMVLSIILRLVRRR